MNDDCELAHQRSIGHRDEIIVSEICGCFYCLHIFPPIEISEWCDVYADEVGGEQYGHTVLCPKCGIDSVIGSKSGYPITKAFLKKMNTRWF